MAQQQVKKAKVPVRLGVAVICAGGFMDAYSYLMHGNVFATGQTGNVVLLCMHIVDGDWLGIFNYLIPIISFVLGIMLSKHLLEHLHGGHHYHMQCWVIDFEILAYICIAFIPLTLPNIVVNSCISFCAALSFENFRNFGTKSAFASTFCTGNLRSLAETLYDGVFEGKTHELHRSERYALLIFAFCMGVVLGKILITLVGRYASIAISALFLIARIIIRRMEPDANRGAVKPLTS